MNYSDVQIILDASKWNEKAKTDIKQVLPHLGKAALSHLSKQINIPLNERLADKIATIISLEPKWYELLQEGKGFQIKDYILNNYNFLSYDMLAVLAIIRDIRNNNAIYGSVTKDLADLFDCIFVDFLTDLNIEEVARLLGERAGHIAEIADLAMEIKRYCYIKNIEDPSSRGMQGLKLALESNTENVGSVPLTSEAGKMQPTIKNWIENFKNQSTQSGGRSVFNVAYFVTHDVSVKLLKPKEQKAISDILKLYNWFFYPVIAEDEIDAYSDNRFSLVESVYLGRVPEAKVTPGLDLSDIAVNRRGLSEEIAGLSKDPTNDLKNISSQDSGMRYNGDKRPVVATTINRRGLALGQQTNIVLDEEEKRLKQEMEEKKSSIETMLRELRSRKQK